jgi:hypothetical protein
MTETHDILDPEAARRAFPRVAGLELQRSIEITNGWQFDYACAEPKPGGKLLHLTLKLNPDGLDVLFGRCRDLRELAAAFEKRRFALLANARHEAMIAEARGVRVTLLLDESAEKRLIYADGGRHVA